MAGLTAAGALALGEVIEKGLLAIPVFNIQIPLLGSLANILGIFFGAVIAGIIGAIALNLIDHAIAKKEKDKLQMLAKGEVVVSANVTKNWIAMNRAYENFFDNASKGMQEINDTATLLEESFENLDKSELNRKNSMDKLRAYFNKK